MKKRSHEKDRQILGRVNRAEFVGRSAELERLLSHSGQSAKTDIDGPRGMLVLLSPLAGVSELLRQTFDSLFQRREVAPIYFALPSAETTAVSAAIEFLNTFLQQYIAFQRDEPSLCHASLTLEDIVQLAPATDADWINELKNAFVQQRFSENDRELVRLCLTAPARVPHYLPQPFVMFDAVSLSSFDSSDVPLALEIVRALQSSGNPFVLAGMRREIVDTVEHSGGSLNSFATLRLERLSDVDARSLVISTAQRMQVSVTEETADLIVQQLEGSPFFITSLLQAAREQGIALESYFACERLYVDELMGGGLHRSFSATLEHVVPEPATRANVVRLLNDASPNQSLYVSADSWRRRLNLEGSEFDEILRRLHCEELINWDGETINPTATSSVWKDYLRSRFRLDSLREPRALVVADLMADSLKRAPQTMAHHYRRGASLRLRELLGKFNSQLVPQVLFDYGQFADVYKGGSAEEIGSALDADTTVLRLPQVFHVASGHSFSRSLRQFSEESNAVAHGFAGALYTDANEVVWLVAKLESKLEASRDQTETWLGQLEAVARQSGFVQVQFWLIANEGFSPEAMELLRENGAFGSSRQQFELLSARLSGTTSQKPEPGSENEFTLVVPMGADNELLAATTVEQVARRLKFAPEAINQIKTAIVEACINASEHSLSPDRKIYQRFRVEDDKLIVTVSSRGVLPVNIADQLQKDTGKASGEATLDERRGWGLKLIKTLMDEVEFERVDEGTSLRMTKYLRKSS